MEAVLPSEMLKQSTQYGVQAWKTTNVWNNCCESHKHLDCRSFTCPLSGYSFWRWKLQGPIHRTIRYLYDNLAFHSCQGKQYWKVAHLISVNKVSMESKTKCTFGWQCLLLTHHNKSYLLLHNSN